MKHNLSVTLFLLLLFFTAQIIGLALLSLTIESIEEDEDGNIIVSYSEPPTGRPRTTSRRALLEVAHEVRIGGAERAHRPAPPY